jgi:16S rRNA (guanine527-N7)-methyltransferase
VFHVKRGLSHVSCETHERLKLFAALLENWTGTLNLISKKDRDAIWGRHINDSLQLVPLIPPDVATAIDLGSGGGFPGLVLAIATGIRFDLIESDQRKAAFLREAIRVTAAPARVHAARIEAAKLPPTRLITARALAPLPELLALAAPHLAAEGQCLFLKGGSGDAELTEARKRWHMKAERFPSQTAPGSAILRISELSRAASAA